MVIEKFKNAPMQNPSIKVLRKGANDDGRCDLQESWMTPDLTAVFS